MSAGWRRLARLLPAVALVCLAAGTVAEQSWQAEYDKVLAAARQEGKVVVSGPPGEIVRQLFASAWAKAYPDITLQYTGARGTQILSKVVRERESGLYNWDVVLASTDPTVFTLIPIHALAPLRDALIDPALTRATKPGSWASTPASWTRTINISTARWGASDRSSATSTATAFPPRRSARSKTSGVPSSSARSRGTTRCSREPAAAAPGS